MAIGLPAKHREELRSGVRGGLLRAAARLALGDLGLAWQELPDGRLRAKTRVSLASMGEVVTLTIEDDLFEVESRSRGTTLFDWGQNRRNVRAFLDAFDAALAEELEFAG